MNQKTHLIPPAVNDADVLEEMQARIRKHRAGALKRHIQRVERNDYNRRFRTPQEHVDTPEPKKENE